MREHIHEVCLPRVVKVGEIIADQLTVPGSDIHVVEEIRHRPSQHHDENERGLNPLQHRHASDFMGCGHRSTIETSTT